MEYIYSSSGVLLAHMTFEINNVKYLYASLAVMSLFVFGLLLCRKFARTPRWLFVSSFISYVLVLVNILQLSFDLRIPKAVGYSCFTVGIYPSILIVASMEGAAEWLFESGWGIMFDETIILYLVAFTINTLVIFAIARLILYIKRNVSAKKLRVKET